MPIAESITYQQLGHETLLMQWSGHIDEEILKSILQVMSALEDNPIRGVKEWNSTYNSLAIHFDAHKISFPELRLKLEDFRSKESAQVIARKWTLPVLYDPSVGIDLEAFCLHKNLSINELISLHTTPTYRIFFIGFLPGFMYLGGLDPSLHLPRKADPDRSIPPGSVAIGGAQTGIYPVESPGGWHVIGNSPLSYFDPTLEKPCFIQPGDEIVFSSVSPSRFEEIKELALKNEFNLKPELING